jgi:hypothetical protein
MSRAPWASADHGAGPIRLASFQRKNYGQHRVPVPWDELAGPILPSEVVYADCGDRPPPMAGMVLRCAAGAGGTLSQALAFRPKSDETRIACPPGSAEWLYDH